MFEKLLTKSALRVILTLALGIVVGLKVNGGSEIVCAISDALGIVLEGCK